MVLEIDQLGSRVIPREDACSTIRWSGEDDSLDCRVSASSHAEDNVVYGVEVDYPDRGLIFVNILVPGDRPTPQSTMIENSLSNHHDSR